jgi:hypothetical protein
VLGLTFFVTHLKPRDSEPNLRQLDNQAPEFRGPLKTVKIHAALARFWLCNAGFGAARPGDGAPALRDVELESRNFC